MNVETILREEIMRRGYTLKNYYDGDGTTSVALILNGDTIEARGVAVTSPFDQFCKEIGRVISLRRALKAVQRKGDAGWINPNRYRSQGKSYLGMSPKMKRLHNLGYARLNEAAVDFGGNSLYEPEMTTKERQLLKVAD